MQEEDLKKEENATESSVLAEIKAQNEQLQSQLKEQMEINKYTLENINTLKDTIANSAKSQTSDEYDEDAEEKARIMKVVNQMNAESRAKREENILAHLGKEVADFDSTFTKENIEKISLENPLLKESLDDMWDAGNREKAAMRMYKAIKAQKKREAKKEESEKAQPVQNDYGYLMSNDPQGYVSKGERRAPAQNVARHIVPQAGDFLPPDSDFINPTPEQKSKEYERLLAAAGKNK